MTIQLDNPELTYTGRIDFADPKHPVWVFPATSLRFRFHGKSAALWVRNNSAYFKNTIGAIVDGKQLRFDLRDTGQTKLNLVDEPEDADHDVLVFKRMDACHEITLERLELSEGSVLLPAPDRPKRRIEVYGDSVSAGEVCEALDYVGKLDPVHNGEYSNSWYSFPWQTARKLGAELHDIAQGGIALLDSTGWYGEPNAVGMESVWDKVRYSPSFGASTSWNFSQWTPDVVVVAIGQNDSHPVDYMAKDPHGASARKWREGYRKMLQNLRSVYPDAQIVCCTTLLRHNAAWDEAISRVVNEMSDPGITQYRFSRNGTGTPGHLRIPEHAEMAEELAAYIESLPRDRWRC